MVTKYPFCHNLTEATKQKTYLMNVVKEYALIQEMSWRPLNVESFGHNLTEATKQKTFLTKVVQGYALMMKMLCRPLNIESFDHAMSIFHNSSFNKKGSLVSSVARFFI